MKNFEKLFVEWRFNVTLAISILRLVFSPCPIQWGWQITNLCPNSNCESAKRLFKLVMEDFMHPMVLGGYNYVLIT